MQDQICAAAGNPVCAVSRLGKLEFPGTERHRKVNLSYYGIFVGTDLFPKKIFSRR